VLVLAAAGCDRGERAAPLVPATGPPGLIRVAVASLGDPTIARNVVGLGQRPPFRVVDAGPRRIVGVRAGQRVEFVRMEPHAAAVAFRRGEVDVAPVPLGDLKAVLRDPALRGSVRVRPLLGVDLVRLSPRIPISVRRFLWLAADRVDYRRLVPEEAAGPAYGLLRDAPAVKRPILRELRRRAKQLPRLQIRLAGGYEAELLAAWWREAGITVLMGKRDANAWFERRMAPYAADEALFVALLGTSARGRPLAPLDAALRRRAEIVPISWIAGAKLVSRRLAGWRQDDLGTTDYSVVRIRASR
jgi:hypothetical protein